MPPTDQPPADHVCDDRCPQPSFDTEDLLNHLRRVLADQQVPSDGSATPGEPEPATRLDGYAQIPGPPLRYTDDVLAVLTSITREVLGQPQVPRDRGIVGVKVELHYEGYDPMQSGDPIVQALGPRHFRRRRI